MMAQSASDAPGGMNAAQRGRMSVFIRFALTLPAIWSGVPGLASETRLGGVRVRQLAAPASVQKAASLLSDPDRAFHVAAFVAPPREAIDALQNPSRVRFFIHDALFAANPDTSDPRKWAPSYRVWNAEFEVMHVAPIDPQHALDLLSIVAARGRQPTRFDPGRARPLLNLLMRWADTGGPSACLYWAHWDNRDDTAFDGVMAFTPRTGEIRVVMTNDFG